MRLTDATMDLNGDYTCTAVNPVGEASDIGKVNILGGLKIEIIDPEGPVGPVYKVQKGDPIEIQCRAFGQPEPTIEWLQ